MILKPLMLILIASLSSCNSDGDQRSSTTKSAPTKKVVAEATAKKCEDYARLFLTKIASDGDKSLPNDDETKSIVVERCVQQSEHAAGSSTANKAEKATTHATATATESAPNTSVSAPAAAGDVLSQLGIKSDAPSSDLLLTDAHQAEAAAEMEKLVAPIRETTATEHEPTLKKLQRGLGTRAC